LKHYSFKPKGVCAMQIDFDIDEDKHIHNVRFLGGCPGNTTAVSRLVDGLSIDETIKRLSGIVCRGGTSCPDQLAKALKEIRC